MADSGKYWVAEPGAQPQGPYDLNALRGLQGQGRITPSTQLCAEGTSTWVSASAVLGGMGAVATAGGLAAPHGGGGSAAGWTPASYLFPILSTIFCCLIGGIISIVYTGKANTLAATGDFAGAERAKSTARTWLIVNLIVGILGGAWLGVQGIGAGIAAGP